MRGFTDKKRVSLVLNESRIKMQISSHAAWQLQRDQCTRRQPVVSLILTDPTSSSTASTLETGMTLI